MSKNKTITPQVVTPDLHDSMETILYSAAYSLDKTVDRLLKPEVEKHIPSQDDIDNAINCVHQLVAATAVFHKGREVRSKQKYLESQAPETLTYNGGDDDGPITH